MTKKKLAIKKKKNQALSSLHTEVSAEPELGDFRTTNHDVVATIELSDMNILKASPGYGDNEFANEAAAAYAQKNKQEPTVAIIPAEDVLPMHQQEKLGGVCCGFCCDYRRAVIWTDVAIVGLVTFFLVLQTGLRDQIELVYWEDAVSDQVYEIYGEYLSRLNIFGYILITSSFASSISASYFSIWIPAFQIVWLLTVLVASCVILNNMYAELDTVRNGTAATGATVPTLSSAAPILLGIGMCVAAFSYPHAVYVYEIHRGILSRDSYLREERCCCS